ncbi:hypothetical protein EDB85DRAFT_2294929 [Lactarius pseudohatsudake]|nr:hypothetical protein EDB85DRAFT_2294929 [Lactarius pseudohatsudake]
MRSERTMRNRDAEPVRPSVNVQPVGEDEHVNVDEPWTHSYIPIFKDIVPHQETRDNLRRQAKDWRGVFALSSPPFPPGSLDNTPVVLSTPPSTPNVHPSPPPFFIFTPSPFLSHEPVRLPPPIQCIQFSQYQIHHALYILIIPSSAYLSDPLKAYAHHGMPKPFVHLFGPPLDVALDARITGNEARFIRSGCRPNAVLRQICSPTKGTDQRDPSSSNIKANEEVLSGWEWDDGNAVHHLPALIEAPNMFQYAAPLTLAHHLSYIRNQMSAMLHALSSTFTTCACGSKAKDCTLNLTAEFVGGRLPVAASPPSQRADDPSGTDARSHRVDLGPLVGAQRGFHTREKSPLNGGMNGVEMIPGQPTGPGDQHATVDVTGLVQKENYLLPDYLDGGVPKIKTTTVPSASPSPRPPTMGNQVEEDRSQEVSDPPRTPDTEDMPPSPMPANLDPTTVSSIPHSTSRLFLPAIVCHAVFFSRPEGLTFWRCYRYYRQLLTYSSNSSPLSPMLSTLTSSFLSIPPHVGFFS